MNGDGVIAPIDVLLVINELNARRLTVPPKWPLFPPPFIVVSGDNTVAPGETLLIINSLDSRG